MSNVVHIFVASNRGAPMSAEPSVEALTDGGLAGDRYAEAKNRRSPDYQVTLMELENIEAFTQATGLPLTPRDASPKHYHTRNPLKRTLRQAL